jgi:hypothetical protein
MNPEPRAQWDLPVDSAATVRRMLRGMTVRTVRIWASRQAGWFGTSGRTWPRNPLSGIRIDVRSSLEHAPGIGPMPPRKSATIVIEDDRFHPGLSKPRGFCSRQQSAELPGRRQRTLCSVIAFTASISSAHKAMLCRSANTSHWWGPISVISTPRQSVDPVATLTDCRDSFLADFVAGENGFVGGHSDSSGAKRTTAPAA